MTIPQPYQRLLIAILLRAIRDIRGIDGLVVSANDRRSAIQWILSESEEPYTYLWICEELHISPRKLLALVISGDEINLPRIKF